MLEDQATEDLEENIKFLTKTVFSLCCLKREQRLELYLYARILPPCSLCVVIYFIVFERESTHSSVETKL